MVGENTPKSWGAYVLVYCSAANKFSERTVSFVICFTSVHFLKIWWRIQFSGVTHPSEMVGRGKPIFNQLNDNVALI